MSKFKVGDKFGITKGSDVGTEWIAINVYECSLYGRCLKGNDRWLIGQEGTSHIANEGIINITNKNNMNIKDKFLLAFKKEPEKSFRLAEITNGDDFLTEDGQKIFLSWLLKNHGEEFKTAVVDDLLK